MLCNVKIPFSLCWSSDKGSRYKIRFTENRRKSNNSGWKSSTSNWDTNKSAIMASSDFTGQDGDKEPGDYDGNLGSCNDTRDWYPTTNNFPDGWIGSATISGNEWNRPGYTSWGSYVYSNGVSKTIGYMLQEDPMGVTQLMIMRIVEDIN